MFNIATVLYLCGLGSAMLAGGLPNRFNSLRAALVYVASYICIYTAIKDTAR